MGTPDERRAAFGPAHDARPTRRTLRAHTASAAEGLLSEAYSTLTLTTPQEEQPRLSLRLDSVALPRLVVSELELTTALLRGGYHPWYSLCLPVRGEVRMTSTRFSGTITGRHGAILAPNDPVTADFRSRLGRMRVAMIQQAALEEELASMLGHPLGEPLRFESEVDDVASNVALDRALKIFTSELMETDSALAAPATAELLGRLVMTGLLTSCRHNYSDQLAAPVTDLGPRPIRKVVQAIEDDPTRFRTVSQIAAEAGLSVRSLEERFQRHLGVSPMRYLRRVRLARVHADLLSADPERTTATTVAHRWGFLHYGRFAAEYREAYGRTPSATMPQTAR